MFLRTLAQRTKYFDRKARVPFMTKLIVLSTDERTIGAVFKAFGGSSVGVLNLAEFDDLVARLLLSPMAAKRELSTS